MLLEPCAVANTANFAELSAFDYTTVSTVLSTLGIESLFGPNWPSQRIVLCWLVGWFSESCDLLYEIPVAVLCSFSTWMVVW